VTELDAALKKIRLVILDVDGVLTDGRLLTHSDGSESKSFHVHDGQGINFLGRAGIKVALITGRASKAVELRASELNIEYLYQGDMNKLGCYRDLLAKVDLPDEAVAYFGDDLPDLPVMRRVGVSIAAADARSEVRSLATHVTLAPGGAGAVREFADLLLKAQSLWQPIVDSFLKDD